MAVFPRGKVWWYKFCFAGQLIRESSKSTSKTVTKNAENQRWRELEQGFNNVQMRRDASCYKGAVMLPGRKHPVRHLVAVSQELHTNGTSGRTLLLRYRREEAWATLVSFLGLSTNPTWADHILGVVEQKKRIEEIDGIGCEPRRHRPRRTQYFTHAQNGN